MDVTNYDVLFIASSEGSLNKISAVNHVGNNRFEVFLNLHGEGFNQALVNGDEEECDRIVDKIIDIVCHKCVPKGRFLEKTNDEIGWTCLGEGPLARMRVREALKLMFQEPNAATQSGTSTPEKDDADKKRRRRGSLTRFRRSDSESILQAHPTD